MSVADNFSLISLQRKEDKHIIRHTMTSHFLCYTIHWENSMSQTERLADFEVPTSNLTEAKKKKKTTVAMLAENAN